eukprot:UN2771
MHLRVAVLRACRCLFVRGLRATSLLCAALQGVAQHKPCQILRLSAAAWRLGCIRTRSQGRLRAGEGQEFGQRAGGQSQCVHPADLMATF